MADEEREPQDRGSEEVPAAESGVLEFGKVVTNGGATVETLLIAGQIEGHAALSPALKSTKYEHVLPQLVLAEEDPKIEGLLLLLHTAGGDVEAGLAMAEMIRGMHKPTVSLVLGGGHSIGIPLAVAAEKSFIAETATMTVHPVRISGLVLGVPQSFEYLRRMQDRISEFIVKNSRIPRETLDRFMLGRSDMATDIGTILGAREAVESGLVDEIGTFSDAMGHLKRRIRENKAQNPA